MTDEERKYFTNLIKEVGLGGITEDELSLMLELIGEFKTADEADEEKVGEVIGECNTLYNIETIISAITLYLLSRSLDFSSPNFLSEIEKEPFYKKVVNICRKNSIDLERALFFIANRIH